MSTVSTPGATLLELGTDVAFPDIIKGFAANAPASALEFVTTMGEQYKVEIEEDGVVTTQGED